MNLKMAHLVAIQFGIFIGTMSWLIYSRLPSPEPPTIGETRGRMVNSIRPDAPLSELRSPRSHTEDYGADDAQSVGELQARTTERYDQEIATRPYANSVPDNRFIAVNSPSYANVDQEPAVVPSDYVESPQTVVYQPIFYAQPTQINAFSNPRRFANRCQSTPQFGAPSTITQQFPDRRNSRLNDPRILPSPIVGPPPCRPTQGFRPRGTVRQSGVPASQPQRVVFPASPGATRRFAP